MAAGRRGAVHVRGGVPPAISRFRRSRQKISISARGTLDSDVPPKAMIEVQDRKIGLASRRPLADIKSVTRPKILGVAER